MKALFLLSLFLSNTAFADSKNTFVIRSATVIDGTEDAPLADTDIEVVDGRISRVGHALISRTTPEIDAHGLYVMPGLIDAHTHLHSVPGSEFRKDSDDFVRHEQQRSLRAYLAAGVTTVLDAAAPQSLFKEMRESEKNKGEYPRILALAPFLTPSGGYFSSPDSRGKVYNDLWPAVGNSSELAQEIQQASHLNPPPLGIKVTFETGFGPFEVWPLFSQELRDTIVAQAAKSSLPIFVHSMSEREHRLALTLKPYTLLHAGFNTQEASPEMIQAIKQSGAYVVSTLAIYKMMLLMWDQDDFNDPWLKRLVPEALIKTAQDRGARKAVIDSVVLASKPSYMPQFLVKLVSPLFFNRGVTKEELSNSEKAVRLMQQAEIPLVMGSDSGN